MRSGIVFVLMAVFMFGIFVMDSSLELTGNVISDDDVNVDCHLIGFSEGYYEGEVVESGYCYAKRGDVFKVENHFFEVADVNYMDEFVEMDIEEGMDTGTMGTGPGDEQSFTSDYYELSVSVLNISEDGYINLAYELTIEKCLDSDNGEFPDVFGSVEWRGEVKEDYCDGNDVKEFSCSPDVFFGGEFSSPIILSSRFCGYGCESGRCLTELDCIDSDGLDYYTRGTLVDAYGSFEDSCLDGKTVIEYYCEELEGKMLAKPKQVMCDGECDDGRCVESEKVVEVCEEFFDDGVRTVEYMDEIYSSYCLSADTLKEYFCKEGKVESVINSCDNGKCIDGDCVIDVDVPKDDLDENPCKEFRGEGDYRHFVEKVTLGGKTYESYCKSESEVFRYYCFGPELASGVVNCPSSEVCSDWKCVTKEDTQESDVGLSNECLEGDKIYSNGDVLDSRYCSFGKFYAQLGDGFDCDYRYQCESDSCVDGKCATVSVWDKLVKWLRNIFVSNPEGDVYDEDEVLTNAASEETPTNEELWCRIGDMFVEDDMAYEYYGKEIQSPVVGDAVEMCCAESRDGSRKECNIRVIVNGVTPTGSDYIIRFEKVNGEFLKTFEISYFMNNRCTYSFDSQGEMATRGC
jgi:hypothetical protein